MPSAFSHAVAAAAIGSAMIATPPGLTVWAIGAICAVLPDIDVISLAVGIPYDHMLGHRGLTHSLPFAAVLASAVTPLVLRWSPGNAGGPRLWTFFFLATASHGLLDALTAGGLGIAFFAPFSDTRYFSPWRPIVVSPIALGDFLGHRGLQVMSSELVWVWLPSAVVFFLAAIARRPP